MRSPPYKGTVVEYVAPAPGSWPEWVIRIGLVGLTVWYLLRVARRVARQSLSSVGENMGS
jgi:hypothetical protein